MYWQMKNIFKYKALTIAILLMFSINFGTSPLPPPYYTYKISGTIFCNLLNSGESYSVLLYGKPAKGYFSYFNDSTYHPIEGMGNYNEHPIDNTDSEGEYYLRVDSETRFDSIKVGIILPNERIVYSIPKHIDAENLKVISEEYDPSVYGAVGCSGCSTENIKTRVVKYNYKLYDFDIIACFD